MSADAPRHSVSVAAAVVDDAGRVLAIRRRDNGRWEPPGGVLELEEGIREGLTREVWEETGLVVQAQRLTGVYKNIDRGIVALVFRCRVLRGEGRPSEETSQLEWLTPVDAAARMSEAYAVRILDAMRDDGPAVRLHNGEELLRQ